QAGAGSGSALTAALLRSLRKRRLMAPFLFDVLSCFARIKHVTRGASRAQRIMSSSSQLPLQAPDRRLLGSQLSRDTEYIAMDCTNHHHASADPGRSGTARRPTQHLLPRAHRIVSALALLVLATMSATLPASEPVPRRTLPTGAELLESRHEWLRPSYFSCMDSAGSVEAREACVDEEFAYHDGELNRIYREKLATLSPRDQGVLREMEQDWISQIYDRRCRMPEQPTAAQRLDIRQCLTAAT